MFQGLPILIIRIIKLLSTKLGRDCVFHRMDQSISPQNGVVKTERILQQGQQVIQSKFFVSSTFGEDLHKNMAPMYQKLLLSTSFK
jgi:hypothetical protein